MLLRDLLILVTLFCLNKKAVLQLKQQRWGNVFAFPWRKMLCNQAFLLLLQDEVFGCFWQKSKKI